MYVTNESFFDLGPDPPAPDPVALLMELVREAARACLVFHAKMGDVAAAYHRLAAVAVVPVGPALANFIAAGDASLDDFARSLVAGELLEANDPIFAALGITV